MVISLLNVPSVPPLMLVLVCFAVSVIVSLAITVVLRQFPLTLYFGGRVSFEFCGRKTAELRLLNLMRIDC